VRVSARARARARACVCVCVVCARTLSLGHSSQLAGGWQKGCRRGGRERWKSRGLFGRKHGGLENSAISNAKREKHSFLSRACLARPFSLPPFALLPLHRSLAMCESPGFYLAREAKRTKRSRGLFSQAANDGGVTGGRKRVDGCGGQRVSFSCAHCATRGRFQERGCWISLLTPHPRGVPITRRRYTY